MVQSHARAVARRYARTAPWYDRLHRRFLAHGGAWCVRTMLDLLEQQLPPGGRLLDLGCGTGGMSRAVCARRPDLQVVGLDVAEPMARRARAHVRDLLVADAHALPLSAGSVDAVVAAWVVEHSPDPGAFLAACERVIRPGGVLVVCHCVRPTAGSDRLRSALTEIGMRWLHGARALPAAFPRGRRGRDYTRQLAPHGATAVAWKRMPALEPVTA